MMNKREAEGGERGEKEQTSGVDVIDKDRVVRYVLLQNQGDR